MSVKDCIIAAGGFTQFGQPKRIRLIAFEQKPGWQEFSFRETIVDFLADTGPRPVTEGSVIIVPEKKFIF